MILFNAITWRSLRQLIKVALSGIALACALPIEITSADTAPSPATMMAPMMSSVPVEIPVPIPVTMSPIQHGRQAEPSFETGALESDQPDIPCMSIDENEARSDAGASPEVIIERRPTGGCN